MTDFPEPVRQEVSHAYEPNCRCAPANVEKLRRFLAFCLAVDYGLHLDSPDKLSQKEFLHWIQLATKCLHNKRPLPGFHHGKGLVHDNSVHVWLVAETQIECYLLDPANAMGIPHGVALSMLRMFAGSVRSYGYKSRVRWMAKLYGPKTVAGKLLYDRKALIDKVVQGADLKKMMKERLSTMQSSWFSRLESIDDFKMMDRKDVVESWTSVEKRHNTHGPLSFIAKRVALQADCAYAEQIRNSSWMHTKFEKKLWWNFTKTRSEPVPIVVVEQPDKPPRPRRRTSPSRAPLINAEDSRDNPFRDPSIDGFRNSNWSLGSGITRSSFGGGYQMIGAV